MTIGQVAEGDDTLATWANAVADALDDVGWVPYAYPVGLSAMNVGDTAVNLAAVSGSNAGVAAIPFWLPAPLSIQSVMIRQGATASQRSCEFALYRDNGDATLDRIAGTTGSVTFTPSAADDRTINVGTPGTIVNRGIVWLVIRCTHASNAFVLRRATVTELATAGFALVLTTASTPALGATFDTSALAGSSGPYLARLQGRIAGKTAAY